MSQSARSRFSLAVLASRLPTLLRPWDWWRVIDRDDDRDPKDGGREQPGDLAAATARAQGRVIRRAFGDDVAAAARDGSGRTEDGAETAYFFRPGHALVREDRLEEVFEFFRQNERDFLGTPERAQEEQARVPGVVMLTLPARRDGEDEVLRTLDELDAAVPPDVGGRPAASPDHVLYVTNLGPHFCPHGEPEEPRTDGPVPRFDADKSWGAEIPVSVVDTGWWVPAEHHPAMPWLHQGVAANSSDDEVIDPNAIHEYGGHGTFVAGVIKCAAPSAQIQVEGALTHGGAVLESEIVAQLHQAYLEKQDPRLISISAGTHSRGDFPLIAFDALKDALGLEGGRTLVIAAAGNDGSDKPFWPAAFPWARGVGAVDPDGTVAGYSNYGADWVDIYARGTDHVNAFPKGIYHCYEPANAGQVRTFDGLAQWSGTSFATPVVTGLVAAEMSRTKNHDDPFTAFDAVLAAGSPGTDPDGNAITIVGPLT